MVVFLFKVVLWSPTILFSSYWKFMWNQTLANFYQNKCRIQVTGKNNTYRKIANSNTSFLEAHIGLFRLLMKGIFSPYTAQCSRPTPELFFWIQLLLLKSSGIVLKSYLEVEIFVFFTLNIVYWPYQNCIFLPVWLK